MKENIHPTYYPDAQVICACGNTWTTGSTIKVIHTDVCSNCHPFYTGEQRIVDTEGQVDRFYKNCRPPAIHSGCSGAAARTSLKDQLLAGLGSRHRSIEQGRHHKVGQALDKLAIGEASLLSIDGFGRKSLADLKKRLRQMGYQLPEAAEDIQV
jgi:large subunit ribosomal protein L31